MKTPFFAALIAAAACLPLHAAETTDPFAPYLDGKAPEILREVESTTAPPEGVTLRSVVFRSRDDSEIFAVIASPQTPGTHPGLLVLHGGGECAAVDQAIAWAQRGYVAVAPDLPGIGEPTKMPLTIGSWSSQKYGAGRWVVTPDARASVLFDAVLVAMKSLYLLRAQPDVDPTRIGVVGISWGGYMTTMVCGLAGDQVKAGFSVFGCGFYEFTSQDNGPKSPLGGMPKEDREQWLQQLHAGRRAPGIKAAFFIAGASNDFFFWPKAVQATLDAIPAERHHFFAPNANHKALVPGGKPNGKSQTTPFVPTPFQPYPTGGGGKDLWLTMEEPYFDYYLKGVGNPLPKVTVRTTGDVRLARFDVTASHPLSKVEVYWAKAYPPGAASDPVLLNKTVLEREWTALPAAKTGDKTYECQLPAEAADWFALISDDRPVTVSSVLIHIATP